MRDGDDELGHGLLEGRVVVVVVVVVVVGLGTFCSLGNFLS